MEIKYKYKIRYIININMEFNSNNNKGLIWSLLQESNIVLRRTVSAWHK